MNSKVLGGILLVAGTAIGAGMLALPVSTGLAGFVPALILLVACWLFMTYTAFLMLEVNLWMPAGTNLITMARNTLGKWGEWVSWIVYLFLLYSLTTAYVAGSGMITTTIIHSLTGISIPSVMGSIPLLLLFSFFVYRGTASVDHINRVLMIGLVIAYGLTIIFLTPNVDASLLWNVEWNAIWIAISLVVTSFGFHIIIPSLSTYLERNVKKLLLVVSIGSLIPLLTYVAWEVVILGIVPVEGAYGLLEGYTRGLDGAQLLSVILNDSWISMLILLFSFFAIVTSFLGVSLSLTDFLADGLKIKRTLYGKTLLYALTFLPPLIFSLADPRAFFSALEIAGAYGVVILLGLIPALMVWRGRYQLGYSSTFKTPGGKAALLLVMACALFVIVLETLNKLRIIG